MAFPLCDGGMSLGSCILYVSNLRKRDEYPKPCFSQHTQLHFFVSPGAIFKSTNKIDGGVEKTGNVRVSIKGLNQ